METDFGANQCVNEAEPTDLDSINPGKACGVRSRKKRRKSQEMPLFREYTCGRRYAHEGSRDIR